MLTLERQFGISAAPADPETENAMRAHTLDLVGQYARAFHTPRPLQSGRSPAPVSGKVHGEEDMRPLVGHDDRATGDQIDYVAEVVRDFLRR